MLTFEPDLQANQSQAIQLAQQFSDHIAAARAQQQTTEQLAKQLRQQLQQAIQLWPIDDQQQFMHWFNEALRDINAARRAGVANNTHVGFYFAIVASILAVGFIGLAIFAALMNAKTFNGS